MGTNIIGVLLLGLLILGGIIGTIALITFFVTSQKAICKSLKMIYEEIQLLNSKIKTMEKDKTDNK